MVSVAAEMEPTINGWHADQVHRPVSVAEAGALADAFVRRFRDEAIPQQALTERRIADLVMDGETPSLLQCAAQEELDAYTRYQTLNHTRKAKEEAHLIRVAEYETMIVEAGLRDMRCEEVRFALEQAIADHQSSFWLETIRMAAAVGAWRIAQDRSRKLQNELRELVSSYPLWIADPYPGTGKTRAIGQVLLASENNHVIHASTINKLSWELQDRHFQDGLRVMTGWSGSDGKGEKLCRRHAQGLRVEALGGRWSTMCKHFDKAMNKEVKCKHFDSCPAQKMMQNLADAAHVALTHNHLQRALPERLSDLGWSADAISIDEAISSKVFATHQEMLPSEINLNFCTEGHDRFADREEAAAAVLQLRMALLNSDVDQGVWFADMYNLPRYGLKLAKRIIVSTLEKRANRRFVDADDKDLDHYEFEDAAYPSARLRLLKTLIEVVLRVRHDDGGRMGRLVIAKNEEGKKVVLIADVQRLSASAVGGKPILHASAFPEPDHILSETFAYEREIRAPRVTYSDGLAWIAEESCYFEVRPQIVRMDPMTLAAGKNVTVTQYVNAGAYIGRLGLRGECRSVVSSAELEKMAVERSWADKTLKERSRELDKRLCLAEFIRREACRRGKVVLVAVSVFREWLKRWFAENGGWPPGLEVLPWGLAVGQNQFEDFDSLIVVGSRIIPRTAQHLRSCAITGQWKEWPAKSDGLDEYSAWALYNEMGQAIERIRTRHDKSKPVFVHAFSDLELPLDAIQVDARREFNEMRLDELLSAGQHEHPLESTSIGNVRVGPEDCLALSVREISRLEGKGNTAARRLAKERSLSGALDGYRRIKVSFRGDDGIQSCAPYQWYAVRDGVDAAKAIEQFTKKKVRLCEEAAP